MLLRMPKGVKTADHLLTIVCMPSAVAELMEMAVAVERDVFCYVYLVTALIDRLIDR